MLTVLAQWSWGLAVLVLFTTSTMAQYFWPNLALSEASLRASYVDEPFHLALLAEFRHHVPAEFPYVSGTPLR